MSVCNKNYLQETFPQYVHDQLNKVAEENVNTDKSQRIFKIIDNLSELKILSFGLASKLKTQEGFMYFPEIISEKNQIVQFEKNESSYFQAWAFANLDLIDMYKLQTFLRILCILAYFECKNILKCYKQITSLNMRQIFQMFLLLQTQKQEYKIEADIFFLQLIEKCECKNNQFISYMSKFCKEKNMLKCFGYLESIKSTNKVSSEKRKGFQKFKEQDQLKKESLQESQQVSQQMLIQTQNPTQIIRRQSSIFPRKSLDQQSQMIQFQEPTKEMIKPTGMNRPSLTMRTIKDGINHKYK